MSTILGSKIISDGLVLYYDTENVKSYPGEPTTNLLPNPTRNGDFTTSTSQWSTYNTNQYNGNQYFSIGVIDNITDNIVTLSSVDHAINSFDVLNPNATGGGVTSGTSYFIKKLSSTQFTLHAYNSSQDGTQGYINPVTGGHKVHDSVWLDERISISESGFPTMWKGNAHLPNSAIVKEIRYGGGKRPNTNCMRCHKNRDINVRDGMAYSVNTPTTLGETYTLTFWVKAATTNAIGKTMNWSSYFGAGMGSFSKSVVLTADWQKATKTFVSTNTYSFISYWWFTTGDSDIWAYDITDIQVEHKGHSTPWTSGTRSPINGLLDLIGNNHANLTSASYDNDAEIDYNGSDAFTLISNDGYGTFNNQSFTIDTWIYPHQNTDIAPIFSYDYTSHTSPYYAIQLRQRSTGELLFAWNDGAEYRNINYSGINCIPDINTWYNIQVVYTSGRQELWVNNVLKQSSSRTDTITFYNQEVWISKGNYVGNFNGKIPILRYYNRALSHSELKWNFNALKGRFGL